MGKFVWGIGLMSGTSADGVDAAVVQFQEKPFKVALKSFFVFLYPFHLRTKLLQASSPKAPLRDVAKLNMEIGDFFADSALKLLKQSAFPPGRISFVGSHGQTLLHEPPFFSVQIGDGNVIAQKTGFLTVSDFRTADMAIGGQGAPLVPYVDWKLFSHPKKNRVLLNLGGIANFTYLPAGGGLQDIVACDCGPGNALSDALVFQASGGKKTFDKNGTLAQKGGVDEALLKKLLNHPFLQLPPPKSAEKRWFSAALAQKILSLKKKKSLEDLLATASAFSAYAVANHIWRYAPAVDEIFVSGGGVKNRAIMHFLKKAVFEKFQKEISIFPFETLGIPAKAKEAVAFAFLAYETLHGKPSNVPSATGAKRECILGKISFGWRKTWRLL